MAYADTVADDQAIEQADTSKTQVPRRINDIIIIGNQTTSRDAMLNYIPYQIGEIFNPQKSGLLIRNLYEGLKRFRTITLKGNLVGDDMIDLYIVVQEKSPLKDILFKGNKNIKETEIRKKINLDIPAVDLEELKVFAEQIKKL